MADSPALLIYNTATDPSPINASTATNSSTARVGINVTPPSGKAVYCKEIDFYIPTKGLSQTDSFSPTVNTTKWLASVGTMVDGSELNLDAGTSYVPVKFSCASSKDYEINYPLIFTIGVTGVTRTPSNLNIQIVEQSSGVITGPFTPPRTSSFVVSVVAASIFVRNFVASKYDASNPTAITPGGDFTNGEPIKLSWEGNAGKYEVFTVPGTTPVYSGTDNSYVLSSGVANATSFVLVGSLVDSVFAETIYRYETLTIRITDPDLTPKSIATAAITGDATVGGTLGVTGASTMAIANITGPLSVGGGAALNGTLDVKGATTLDVASIAGALAASGSVSMIQNATSVKAGSYVAKTDGFVVGVVGAASSAAVRCVTWMFASTTGVAANTVGGNVSWVATDMRSGVSYSNHGSFTLPVRQGAPWSVTVTNASGNTEDAPTSIFWIPLGSDSGSSLEALSEAEADQLNFDQFNLRQAAVELIQPE
ncbi:hypothetical protein [uncultured Gimesia sp.]|uniref:hypothetical protein n=1 Tax=uncultured Gimesia sp. TaxID=1678688 RepID=UPI0030DBC4FE|tara:strand:+ start:35524 stop:36969 length:1446 start_codon:yes stop_codon:yes gene_type:complete